MVTWLAQQSFVRVAEVERLVQAAIHGLDALQGIIMDPIFGELRECLAEILVRRIRETCSNPPTMDPVATPDMTEATHAEPSNTRVVHATSPRDLDPAGGQGSGDEFEDVTHQG